jgi:predicted ribosome quality control (RQC) complex YloA/Tae2 family protein
MILNYHTLRRWVEEVAQEITGAKVIEIFSQTRDVLHIGMVTVYRHPCALEISSEKKGAHIFLQKDYRRKSKNSADLFQDVVGEKISRIEMDEADRLIRLHLTKELTFEIEFFSGVNVYLLDLNRNILEAFKESKEHVGRIRPSVTRECLEFGDALKKKIHSLDAFKAKLSEGLAHFNKHLALECLHKTKTLEDCFENTKDILSRLNEGKPRIYRHFGEPKIFSLIELEHYREKHPGLTSETYDSVNDAIRAYVNERFFYERKKEKLQDIARAVRIRIRKNETLIEALEEDREKASAFEWIERQGHLLNLNISKITPGMDVITVDNIYDEKGDTTEIALNPEWPPKRNVEEYFTRSKKMRQSVNKIADRIQTLQTETHRLSVLISEMESAEKRDWKKIEKTYDEFTRAGWIKKRAEEKRFKPEKDVPTFREFTVPGNWRVFVGQNDTKNDQLTFKFAKSDDYWFHARGVPGSHVVLKRDGRRDNPGKYAIEAAASIAAWFSKAKTSSLVPVAYTLKKYVRKPKGARPGQVMIEREEVVIVPPKEMN